MQVFELLKSQYQFTHIYVYGELFGGIYPHPDVQPVANVRPVQTGIYYSPDILFIAFDLAIGESNIIQYLDYSKSIDIFNEADVLYSAPLYIGSFTEALQFNERFTSTIPHILGLPKIENNWAEGIVIKSMQEIEVKTKKGLIRPILKKKIPEFAEDERFHQAQKQSSKPNINYIHPLDHLEYEISQLVNINRVNSAISKVGKLETHRTAIKTLIAEDIREYLQENHHKQIQKLSREDKKLLETFLDEQVDNLMSSIRYK